MLVSADADPVSGRAAMARAAKNVRSPAWRVIDRPPWFFFPDYLDTGSRDSQRKIIPAGARRQPVEFN
jgi:hypothetical protein